MKKDIWFTNLSSPTIILPDGTHADFIVGYEYPSLFKTIYRAYLGGFCSLITGITTFFADWTMNPIPTILTIFMSFLLCRNSWRDIKAFKSWNSVNCIQIFQKTHDYRLIVMKKEVDKAKYYNVQLPSPSIVTNEEDTMSRLNEKFYVMTKLPGVRPLAFYVPGKTYPSFFYSKFSAKVILGVSIMAYLLMLYAYNWSWIEWFLLASSVTGILISIKDIKAFNEWGADNCVEIAIKTEDITDAASKK